MVSCTALSGTAYSTLHCDVTGRSQPAPRSAPIRVEAHDFNISAPHMHATCLEALALQPGHKVGRDRVGPYLSCSLCAGWHAYIFDGCKSLYVALSVLLPPITWMQFLDVGSGCGILTAAGAYLVGRGGMAGASSGPPYGVYASHLQCSAAQWLSCVCHAFMLPLIPCVCHARFSSRAHPPALQWGLTYGGSASRWRATLCASWWPTPRSEHPALCWESKCLMPSFSAGVCRCCTNQQLALPAPGAFILLPPTARRFAATACPVRFELQNVFTPAFKWLGQFDR